jgi:hypothetical protein
VARIEGPDGSDVRGRMEGSTLVFVPRRPGAYAVSLGDAPPMAWVAVNVDPEEGDVRNYGSIVATERELAPELLQRHVDLARPALVLALLIFLAQGLLAMRGVA